MNNIERFENLLSNYLKPRPNTMFGGGFTILKINYVEKTINIERLPRHSFTTDIVINYLEIKHGPEDVYWTTMATDEFEKDYRNTDFDYVGTPIDDDYFNMLLEFRKDNNFLEDVINFLEKELLIC